MAVPSAILLQALLASNDALEAEVVALRARVATLDAEMFETRGRLVDNFWTQHAELKDLTETNDALQAAVAELGIELDGLRVANAVLEARIAARDARVAELEAGSASTAAPTSAAAACADDEEWAPAAADMTAIVDGFWYNSWLVVAVVRTADADFPSLAGAQCQFALRHDRFVTIREKWQLALEILREKHVSVAQLTKLLRVHDLPHLSVYVKHSNGKTCCENRRALGWPIVV